MVSGGVAMLLIYVFVVFTVILPLLLIPISAGPVYTRIIGISTIIGRYYNVLVIAVVLIVAGAVLTYRYGQRLSRPFISDVVRVYRTHGVLDVFLRRKLLLLYLSLLAPALVTYLISMGVIRIVNLKHLVINTSLFRDPTDLLFIAIGITNLALSAWLMVSTSYMQLRIATRRMVSRLGSVIGSTVSIAASTGTAVFIGSACGLGFCTAPAFSISPMAMIIMSIFDVNALELIHYSLIVLPFLTLITLTLLVVIHRSLVRVYNG